MQKSVYGCIRSVHVKKWHCIALPSSPTTTLGVESTHRFLVLITIQYSTMQHSTVQYDAMRCNTSSATDVLKMK